MEKLLTLVEAAAVAGVSKITLRRWLADGRIAVVKLSSRSHRILADDLERFVASRRVQSKKRAG